jgi:hypothetical protein
MTTLVPMALLVDPKRCALAIGIGMAFAKAEGLEIELVRDMTWATMRDRLSLKDRHPRSSRLRSRHIPFPTPGACQG